jgi:hypothetical protein
MPSVAELWHVPGELRNKIGGWNKDEVREQVKLRMPDHYSHFKLQSSLHVKNAVVNSISNLCGAIRVADETMSWPELCPRTTCDVTAWKVDDGVVTPSLAKPNQPTADESNDSSCESSSSSSPSSSSGEPLSCRVRPRTDDVVMLPWMTSDKGSVIHVTEAGKTLCNTTARGGVTTGSTMTSAVATGKPLCNRCWRDLGFNIRQQWLGEIA